jgi:transcriptional regulator with XRE-family HTH domain
MRQLAHPMPHIIPSSDSIRLVVLAQRALGMSQGNLADLVQSSRRTISRWTSGGSMPSPAALQAIARAVHATDAELAAQLAAESGETLESLGIVQPAPPPVVFAPAPPPLPRHLPPARLMVESVVCAAAEAMQTTPSAVRDVLRTAFARARGLGMTIEEVDDALSPAPGVPPAQPGETEPQSKGRSKR